MTTTDAPPDVSNPSADDDGDGVINADDNCPGKDNPQQYDEDGDQIGDACDSCLITNMQGGEFDSDGDGLGNGCDPSPSLNDQVLLFDGFNEAPTGTIVAGPAATFTGGQAVFNTGPGVAMRVSWPGIALSSTRRTYVWTRMHIVAHHSFTGTSGQGAGPLIALNAAGDHNLVCMLGIDPSTGNGRVLFADSTGNNDAVINPAPAVAAPGTVARMILYDEIFEGSFQCGADTTGTTAQIPPAVGSPMMIIGLHARAAHVKFDYIYVLQSDS